MHRLPINFSLNLTYDEPGSVWRQVTGDVRFGKALNLSINRQEIIDTFYLGQFAIIPELTTDGVYDGFCICGGHSNWYLFGYP